MAKRQAQAHSMPSPAVTPSAIDLAEEALAERIRAFTAASEALRAEIKAFEAARGTAEGRASEPALRLVVSRETAEMEAMGEALPAPPPEPAEPAAAGRPEPEQPLEDERPTPEQIAEFFRTHEERATAEVAAPEPPEPEPTAREQLYADLCGAAIGLCGAAALINFVLLK